MNKIYIISIFLFGLLSVVKAQKNENDWIIARWQLGQAELTSMNLDMYEFHRDSIFLFMPNSYNGLNRIIEIEGRYSITGDSIIFIPMFTKEVFGGHPVRSEITTLSDTWEILGGKIKRIKCSKITPQKAYIHCNPDEKTFLLDTQKYYKTE